MKNIIYSFLFLLFAAQFAHAQWSIPVGDTTIKIPVQAINTADSLEKTDVGSMSCRRAKNGTDGACSGTSAEVSDGNHPGLWMYTLGSGDVDTSGSLILRFTATGMNVFRSANQVGTRPANLIQVNGVDVPNLYAGTLVSVSGTLIGVASGHIVADDQFINGSELVVYDSTGKVKAKSCIVDSTNTGDTVVTRDNISALIAIGNNYIIRSEGGCSASLFITQAANITGTYTGNLVGNLTGDVQGTIGGLSVTAKAHVNTEADTALTDYGALRPTTAGRTLDIAATGEAGLDLSNVNGTLDLTEVGTTFYAGMFSANTGTNYAAAHANSVVKQTADNASGGGGGGGACDVTSIGGVAIATPEIPGYLPCTIAGENYGTAQSYTNKIVKVAALENFPENSLANNFSLMVFDATTNKYQSRCICKNANATDDITLCEVLNPIPTGTLKYYIFKSPECNLQRYPTSH